MDILFSILFWLSLAGVLLTYLIYPLWMLVFPGTQRKFNEPSEWPTIEVIFAAHNEEKVIREKILSTFTTSYPLEKLTVHVGSDRSNDQTEVILKEMIAEFPGLRYSVNEERIGKSGTINRLVRESEAEVLIATDANILFRSDTLKELVQPFTDPEIVLTGGVIHYRRQGEKGISQQEDSYLNIENRIKFAESRRWFAPMGVEGGCYAVRRSEFPFIPPLTFMEDFYVTLALLSRGKKVVMAEQAYVLEDVSTQRKEEFKRKTRISIGNFQNLSRFFSQLWKRPYPIGWAFLCHKILRWLTPILLLVNVVSTLILWSLGQPLGWLLLLQILVLLSGMIELTLEKMGFHFRALRFVSHFIWMNVALFWGLIKFLIGVKSNVWQPTQRNQE